ncbi:hypothetical protein WR25_16664 [Diploscapter pachys]|uniref:Phosphofurin acidic cluster sorting protein 1/2 C-terminal domain-containing protein n=1 Tax=Diploscapter pachys TaxID=2018661 RepID=A0A2A2KDH8_9BILA|nr:hypothetical protein WR25_16664 [Diploscapter pachys]
MHMETELPELSARSERTRIRDPRKFAHRKNIKQRFVSLLRKFKVPEDEASATCSSIARAPTAKELEALFEELEGMSDSGPEMAADEISIGSNPRPALRPYFTRSKEILPAIYDPEADIGSDHSESEGEDSSSEAEHQKENRLETPMGLTSTPHTPKDVHQGHRTPTQPFGIENFERKGTINSPPKGYSNGDNTVHVAVRPSTSNQSASYSQGLNLPHSLTIGSISREKKMDINRVTSLTDQLSSSLLPESASDCLWLCSLGEFSNFSAFSPILNIVNCSSSAQTKQIIGQVVNKIQNFCNSNSVEPSLTYIGIAGGDRLLGQVLRAYVDCLHHKSSSNWLQYLRFMLLPYPNSLCGRMIEGIDVQLDQLCRDIWERWAELPSSEKSSVAEKLAQWPKQTQGSRISLPIGEVMMQVSESTNEPESELIFVPFLTEIRVGASDDVTTDSEGQTSSPRSKQQPTISSEATTTTQEERESSMSKDSGASPPNSPYARSDISAREMSVEFWTNPLGENVALNASFGNATTPTSKKDNSKSTIKSTFRSLIVHRNHSNALLSMSYVKEKKKDKMLHKLGMKKGQKSDLDMSPVQISSITRVLCCPTSKHHSLNVFVDGALHLGVRYFQTSAQWQTHIKTFPLTLLSQIRPNSEALNR